MIRFLGFWHQLQVPIRMAGSHATDKMPPIANPGCSVTKKGAQEHRGRIGRTTKANQPGGIQLPGTATRYVSNRNRTTEPPDARRNLEVGTQA